MAFSASLLPELTIPGAPSVSKTAITRPVTSTDIRSGGDVARDATLVARIADGDPGAARQVVERFGNRLMGFAFRMTADRSVSEDIVQETFLRLWKNAGNWKPKAPLKAWLHRVAYNLAIDHLRRPVTAPEEAGLGVPDPEPGPADRLQESHVGAAVAGELAALPERQRAALALVYYQDLTNIEAAAAMDISVEALESLLSRARRTLRARLEGRREELVGDLK